MLHWMKPMEETCTLLNRALAEWKEVSTINRTEKKTPAFWQCCFWTFSLPHRTTERDLNSKEKSLRKREGVFPLFISGREFLCREVVKAFLWSMTYLTICKSNVYFITICNVYCWGLGVINNGLFEIRQIMVTYLENCSLCSGLIL